MLLKWRINYNLSLITEAPSPEGFPGLELSGIRRMLLCWIQNNGVVILSGAKNLVSREPNLKVKIWYNLVPV